MSAHADDLLIVRSARSKDMIVAFLQSEVDKVAAWSDKTRLDLNTSKCETAFFSLDRAEAAWQPNITIDGKRTFCNPFQVFLGVRCDRQLTFADHVRKLAVSFIDLFNTIQYAVFRKSLTTFYVSLYIYIYIYDRCIKM